MKWTGSLLTERRMPNRRRTHVCTTPTPVVAAALVARSHTRALLRSSTPPAFAKSLRKATGLRPPCSGCLREETSRTSGRACTPRSGRGLGGNPPPQGGKKWTGSKVRTVPDKAGRRIWPKLHPTNAQMPSQNTPDHAISARSDLAKENASPNGGVDAKVLPRE